MLIIEIGMLFAGIVGISYLLSCYTYHIASRKLDRNINKGDR